MLNWYRRLIAITYAYGGMVHVANLLGLGPEVPADRAGLFRAFDIYFLVLDAVAAVGLWRGKRIGLVAFVVATASQLVMYAGFGDFFAANEMMRAQLNGLLAYHVVAVTGMGAVHLFADESGAKEAICRRPLLSFTGVAFAFTAMAWIPAIVAGGVSELPTGVAAPPAGAAGVRSVAGSARGLLRRRRRGVRPGPTCVTPSGLVGGGGQWWSPRPWPQSSPSAPSGSTGSSPTTRSRSHCPLLPPPC